MKYLILLSFIQLAYGQNCLQRTLSSMTNGVQSGVQSASALGSLGAQEVRQWRQNISAAYKENGVTGAGYRLLFRPLPDDKQTESFYKIMEKQVSESKKLPDSAYDPKNDDLYFGVDGILRKRQITPAIRQYFSQHYMRPIEPRTRIPYQPGLLSLPGNSIRALRNTYGQVSRGITSTQENGQILQFQPIHGTKGILGRNTIGDRALSRLISYPSLFAGSMAFLTYLDLKYVTPFQENVVYNNYFEFELENGYMSEHLRELLKAGEITREEAIDNIQQKKVFINAITERFNQHILTTRLLPSENDYRQADIEFFSNLLTPAVELQNNWENIKTSSLKYLNELKKSPELLISSEEDPEQIIILAKKFNIDPSIMMTILRTLETFPEIKNSPEDFLIELERIRYQTVESMGKAVVLLSEWALNPTTSPFKFKDDTAPEITTNIKGKIGSTYFFTLRFYTNLTKWIKNDFDSETLNDGWKFHYDYFINTPYFNKLSQLKKDGKITQEKLEYLMGQDIEDQGLLKMMESINAVRVFGNDEKYLHPGKVMTIERIREQNLKNEGLLD